MPLSDGEGRFFLLDRGVDVLPVSFEVNVAGPNRQNGHRSHRYVGNGMTAEEFVIKHGLDDSSQNENDLYAGLNLAELVCRDDNAVGIGNNHTHGGNGKLTEDNDNRCGEQANAVNSFRFEPESISARYVAKRDQSNEDHQLVCQRVHEFTEVRYEVVASGEITVKKVGGRCKCKECCRDQSGPNAQTKVKGDENHQERYHDHSRKRKLVG